VENKRPVLKEQGLIQSELPAGARYLSSGGVAGVHDLDWVARDQMNRQEYQSHDSPEQGDREEGSAEGEGGVLGDGEIQLSVQ
jgi:hypothetical protein